MTSSNERIRILVADDHPFFRTGLRNALRTAPDIKIVGEAANGADAVAQAKSLQPDVVLMDIQMPGMSGVEATRQILQTQPQAGILILTMFEDDDLLFAVMRAGARGYVLKGADRSDLVRAIRSVAKGEALFGPAMAGRLTNIFMAFQPSTPIPFPELSPREREILSLMAQGYDNGEVAHQLALHLKTVRNYVSIILDKLQVVDRTQAILRAREAGLGVGPGEKKL